MEATRLEITRSTTFRIDPAFALESSIEPNIRERIEKAMTAAMAKRIAAWEKATLEAAFDCGIDLRQPWGDDLVFFAQMTWNHAMGAKRLDRFYDFDHRMKPCSVADFS